MKQFIRRVFGFVLLILMAVLLICEIEIPDSQVIRMTQKTSYEKISWNLDLIRNNSKRITNAAVFIGPSWLEGGINDSILNSRGYNSINMGVSHGGVDLDYYLVSKIIAFKPKIIFLHRFPDGQVLFHPMTPLLLTPSRHVVTFHNLSSNFVFEFIPKRFYFVMKFLFLKVFDFFYKPLNSSNKFRFYGWRPNGNTFAYTMKRQADELVYNKIIFNERIASELINENGVLTYSNNSLKNSLKNCWRHVYSKLYTGNGEFARTMTISLCKEKNINVAEIYIPHLQMHVLTPNSTRINIFFERKVIQSPVII